MKCPRCGSDKCAYYLTSGMMANDESIGEPSPVHRGLNYGIIYCDKCEKVVSEGIPMIVKVARKNG